MCIPSPDLLSLGKTQGDKYWFEELLPQTTGASKKPTKQKTQTLPKQGLVMQKPLLGGVGRAIACMILVILSTKVLGGTQLIWCGLLYKAVTGQNGPV